MDIATYDFEESVALSGVERWRSRAAFGPAAFERVGFPSRVRHQGELRSVLQGFYSAAIADSVAAGLSVATVDELKKLVRTAAAFVTWHRTTFPQSRVPVPVGDLVSQFSAYIKLCGLPSRRRVLEIGPGLGLSASFASLDPQIERYDLVEVTQSLYILQAAFARHVFGPAFRNHALTADERATIGRFSDDRARSLVVPESYACHLYPWWHVDAAMDGPYDAIASHANLAEMDPAALDYYLRAWPHALAADGFVLVQDIGDRVLHSEEMVFSAIDRAGFRALFKARSPEVGRVIQGWNLILVHETHPDYAAAEPLRDGAIVLRDHPVVRSVFRLDSTESSGMTVEGLLQTVGRLVGATEII